METVAFYSYKSGVGRSGILANAARFLTTIGKGVVALDGDFEAPGLPDEFDGVRESAGGAIPYLMAASNGTATPPALDEYLISVPIAAESGGWLRLMPAGPAAHLQELGDWLRLTDSSGPGFIALRDLPARIADELKPHYLLIDACAGMTELWGLATTVLADTVACVCTTDQEAVDGTVAAVKALLAASRAANRKPIRIVLVLPLKTLEQTQDPVFAAGLMRLMELGRGSKGSVSALLALPPGDAMGILETLAGSDGKSAEPSLLDKAYIELFHELFPGI